MLVPLMIFLKIGQAIMPRWKYNVVCFLNWKLYYSAILQYSKCFSQSNMYIFVKITHYSNRYEKYIPQLGAKIYKCEIFYAYSKTTLNTKIVFVNPHFSPWFHQIWNNMHVHRVPSKWRPLLIIYLFIYLDG